VPAAARRPAAPPLAAAPSAPAPAPAPAPRAADLARIAARVAEYSGDVDATARAAGAARGERERALVQRELFIALHRAVCAPVFEVDPEDVEAARHALGAAFPRQPETACRGGEDVAGLEALLRAAPDLRRLAAGGALRSAARLAALGRGGEARRLIDAVPEDLRGLTWALVSAWTARLERDPVRAARDLSRVDRDTLDRLRTSAADDVARLVSRASAVAP
nr:hypothetical protein [Acidobacteriota bacterium]